MVSRIAVEALRGNLVTAADELAALLADLTHEFASSLHIGETLRNALDRILAYLDAEAGSIFLLERDGSALVCRQCAGPVNVAGVRLAPNQGIVGRVVQENAPLIVRDVTAHPDFAAMVDAGTGFATRSILCTPLAVHGQCIGALELINKRGGDGMFDQRDLRLLGTVAAAAALAINNARMAEALVEQERVRRELELARQIQESLLPRGDNVALPVSGLNLPAREVSGDFFDFFELPDGRIYFNIADVSGKGINAALLMARTCSLLRCLARDCADVGELLGRVNRELCDTASLGMFVTVVSGFVASDRASVTFANAGHPAVLVRDPDGSFQQYGATAPPLGILPGIEFPALTVPLRGRCIYLHTDGILESVDTAGVMLGEVGIQAMYHAVAALSALERLPEIVTRWRQQGWVTRDDVTLLLIEG
jgi:sigma-B regulation protein RsbU (phosphoserine phosphatase)